MSETSSGIFGFAIQSAEGGFVAPDTWLPATIGKIYEKPGGWAETEAVLSLVPGITAKLPSWIQDRDRYNQGKCASVLLDHTDGPMKMCDAKVRGATFIFVKGQPVSCTLDIVALHTEISAGLNSVMPVTAPYIYQGCGVDLATGGGALTEDTNCESIVVSIDNMIERRSDGLRLAASTDPVLFQNVAGIRAYGTLSRDFVDSAVYADFADGEEAALMIELRRGHNSVRLALPRILYTQHNLQPRAHLEHVAFIALGSSDGVTPPIVLA